MKPMMRQSRVHYGDVIMGAIASQITSLIIVYSTVYSDADLRKHQSSASLGFVWGIHRGPVNSPHKWPVMRKMFLFNDVIMRIHVTENWGIITDQWPVGRAPSQYPKRRLSVRSRKVSKPRDLYLELSDRSEIWQALRQQCCRCACQISKRYDNLKYQSRGFETLRDLTKRRLFWYWDGAQVPKPS